MYLTPLHHVTAGSEVLIGPWSHIGLLDNRIGHARSGMFSAFALHSYALDFARRCCAAQPAPGKAAYPGGSPTGQLGGTAQNPMSSTTADGAAAASGGIRPDGQASPEPGFGAGSGPGRREKTLAASSAAAGSTTPVAGEPASTWQECNGAAHATDLHPPDAPGNELAAEAGGQLGPAAMELPADRMPIHYYLMGWRPRWEAAPRWPPPEVAPEPVRLYLAQGATKPDLVLPERAHVRAVPGGKTAAVRRPRNPLGVTFPQPEFLQAAGGTARPLQLSTNPRGSASPAGTDAAAGSAGPAATGAADAGALPCGDARDAPDSAGTTGANAAGAADLEAGVSGSASHGVVTIGDPSVGACGRRTGSTAQVRRQGWLWYLWMSVKVGPSRQVAAGSRATDCPEVSGTPEPARASGGNQAASVCFIRKHAAGRWASSLTAAPARPCAGSTGWRLGGIPR